MLDDRVIRLMDKAISGNIFAAAQLGEGYMKGTFGQKNPEKAAKWLHYAAKHGNDHAEELLKKLESEENS